MIRGGSILSAGAFLSNAGSCITYLPASRTKRKIFLANLFRARFGQCCDIVKSCSTWSFFGSEEEYLHAKSKTHGASILCLAANDEVEAIRGKLLAKLPASFADKIAKDP